MRSWFVVRGSWFVSRADAVRVDTIERPARTAVETGLPTTDPVRYDPAPVVEAIDAIHGVRASVAVG